MANLRTLSLSIKSGKFLVGEKVTTGKATTTVTAADSNAQTITVESPVKGLFELGSPVIGLKSQAVGVILNNEMFTEIVDSTISSVTGVIDSAVASANDALNSLTSTIAGLEASLTNTAQDLLSNLLSEIPTSISLQVLTVSYTTGTEFIAGEKITTGSVLSVIQSINIKGKTITVIPPVSGAFQVNDIITGLQSATVAKITNISESDTFDLFNLFGDNLPADFSLTDFISGIAVDPNLNLFSTNDIIPDLSSTFSVLNKDVVSDPSVIVDETINAIRDNPLNPGTTGLASPNDRHRTNIANEPTDKFEAQYPYNKSYRSEGGHLIEVDDTPGKERLLNEHISGTYTEMKSDGNFVTKVTKDNYTVICGDGYVTVEGKASVYITGDCTLKVGGVLTVSSDTGINLVTKGDFRLKANSINMESTSGNISGKSAADVLFTATESTNIKSKKNLLESAEITSITTGEQFIVDSNKIFQNSKTDITLQSKEKTSINSTGDFNLASNNSVFIQSAKKTNIKSGEETSIGSGAAINLKSAQDTKVTAPALEVDAVLNVKASTNMKATGTDSRGDTHDLPINGQGADAAADAAAATPGATEDPVLPADSKGSGITFIQDPEKILMAVDDDPELALLAIKDGLDKGTINKKEFDEKPPSGGSSDTAAPTGNRATLLDAPTIKDVGTTPPDNLRLSTNFTLGQVSKFAPATPCAVVAQEGLTVDQIVQNLQLLSQNCLEKIKIKYPNMFVSSGFRSKASNSKSGSKTSQHLTGQAVDMQFTGAKKSDYFAIAQWIKDNVPYDQLLLEYKSTGTKLPWIHISFRGRTNRNEIKTMWNHSTYRPGLHDLSDRK